MRIGLVNLKRVVHAVGPGRHTGAAGSAAAGYNPAMDTIKVDPEIQGGTPCFAGTRVPVVSLFQHLAAGVPLGEFLEDFPSVEREQAVRVIEHAGHLTLADAAEGVAAGR